MSEYFGPPIAPERNPPIVPQYFAPSVYQVTNIVLGLSTLVTTAVEHNYVIGQLVRLSIPFAYGTYQLNQAEGYVHAIPTPTQVILGINSLGFNPYVAMPIYGPTPPQISAIGDVNTGLISSTGRSQPTTTIPGSYINISPSKGTWFN
jgi:hypothetical protein